MQYLRYLQQVARHFLKKGSLFHHHQLPEDRPYRIVLRNIHHKVSSEDIIACLQNEGIYRGIWEKQRKQVEPVQCYGHTKTYCSRHFICRECGENHPTSECRLKQDDTRCCYHCGKPPAANFKGCIKYLKEASTRKHHLKTNEPTAAGLINRLLRPLSGNQPAF